MPGKKSSMTATKKLSLPFRQIFPLILSWFWQFYAGFCRFASFWPLDDTATSCHDADFFPAMRYIFIYLYIERECSMKRISFAKS